MMTCRASRAALACLLAACGNNPSARPERDPEGVESKDLDAAQVADPRRWLAGDLHMHVAPPDDPGDVALSAGEIAEHARAAGLDFVVLTPHLWQGPWRSKSRRAAWLREWTELATSARAEAGVTLIPGVEYGVPGVGHFGVSGVDLTTLHDDDLLAAAHAAGGFVVVNHPFAVPTKIPGIPVSEADLSFRPWARGRGDIPELNGVEVWNLPLGLANLVSRPGGKTGEERAFLAADELARHDRRRITITGGSDSHRAAVAKTTWVLAADTSEAAILAALRAGATCVGSPAAGTLEARGDDGWVRIGDSVRATSRVELRWQGRARLFVDGADAGEHDGGWIHDGAAGVHTYRIVAGDSRCGFVYANL